MFGRTHRTERCKCFWFQTDENILKVCGSFICKNVHGNCLSYLQQDTMYYRSHADIVKSICIANLFTQNSPSGGMSFVGLCAFRHLVRNKYFKIFRLIQHV